MDDDWGYVRRSRKPVDRFVAEPASYRTPGDFVKPERVGKDEKVPKSTGRPRGRPRKSESELKPCRTDDEEIEPLQCRPEYMLGRRVKVFWEAEQQHFFGEVRSYEPSLQHPFTIVYEDEDVEDGVFYENFFMTDEDVKRPYEVIGEGSGHEKPAAMRKSATDVEATVEHGSAAAREPAPQPKAAVERSGTAKETAPQSKVTVGPPQPAAARNVAPEPKAVAEEKPAARGPQKMPAPAVRPAPLQNPGSRPSSGGSTKPTPQPTLLTPGVLSKFQQELQKHTSGAARNATSPSTPDHAGSQRKPVPVAGVVMGIPVPGSRGPVGQSSPAGPSKAASIPIPAQGQVNGASIPFSNQKKPSGGGRPTPAVARSAMLTGISTSMGAATQPRKPVSKLDSLIPDWQATRHAAVVRAQPSPNHSSALPKQAQQPAGDAQGPATVLALQGIREAGVANGGATELAGSVASLQDPARPGAACAAPSRLAAAPSPAHNAGKGLAVSKAEAAAPAVGTAADDAPQRKRGRLPKDADPNPPPAKKRGRPRKVGDAGVPQQQQQQQPDVAADDAKMEDGSKGAAQQEATQGKRRPKNGHGPLAADTDPSPAQRPEGQQAVSARKPATPPEETTKVNTPPQAPTGAGVSSPAPVQPRPLSGGAPPSTSASSPVAAYDARAAAQPLRKAATAASAPAIRAASKLRPQAAGASVQSPAARTEASPAQLPSRQQDQKESATAADASKLRPQAATASVRSPAARAEASPAQLPSGQQDQKEPATAAEPAAPAERDPWSVSPPSTGGVAPNSDVRSPVMGYASPGLQPAKAAAHPQVTKLITMLPSKLSPAYTPSVRQTPGGSSAKRSSFGGSHDAAGRILGTPDGPGSDAAAPHGEDAEEKSKEDLEVAKRRRAQESIMRKVDAAMKGLTRNKDSIRAATSLATQAAHRDAAPRVMRLLMQRMEKEMAGPKRVDLLYLTDSLLQNCRNSKNSGCGPDSAPGQAYPRVIAAALPALIRCVAEDSEGALKADKVLKLWAKRDLLPATSLQPEIERLQERLLQHSAANAAKAATDSLLKQANDIMNNGGNSVVRIGSEAGGGALMELKEEEDDDWDDDQAAPLPTLPQKQEEHCAPWQRTGGTDVAVGAAPGSPEGSPWHQGVSPTSSGYAPWSPLSSADGQGTPQHVPAAIAAAPWNQPAAPGLGPPVAAHGQDPVAHYSGYRITAALAAALAVPPPQPPSVPQPSWPHAQQQSTQQPGVQPLIPGHNGDTAATTAPQPIAWEPEESWDSDAEAVPPGLSNTPKNSRGRQPWRQGSLNSPDSHPPRNGSAPGPSRLSAAATEPARLLDEYDDLYNTAQPATQPVRAAQPRQPSRALPAPIMLRPPPPMSALFPRPSVLTPPAQAAAPPQYALPAAPQEYGELPPLPEDDPPPLPDAPPPDDYDDFQPPLPDEPPPPMPPSESTGVRQGMDMDVDMDVVDAGVS